MTRGTDGPASDVAGAPFHMRALDAVLVTAVGATVGEFERARGVAAAVLGRLRAGGATTQTVRDCASCGRLHVCMYATVRMCACSHRCVGSYTPLPRAIQANELRLIKARLSAFDAHSARVHGAISAVIGELPRRMYLSVCTVRSRTRERHFVGPPLWLAVCVWGCVFCVGCVFVWVRVCGCFNLCVFARVWFLRVRLCACACVSVRVIV